LAEVLLVEWKRYGSIVITLMFALAIQPAISLHAENTISPSPEELISEQWRWSRFGAAHGIPAGDIALSVETADGQLWVAGTQGLSRFDGYRWQQHPRFAGQRVVGLLAYGPRSILVFSDRKLYLSYGKLGEESFREVQLTTADGKAYSFSRIAVWKSDELVLTTLFAPPKVVNLSLCQSGHTADSSLLRCIVQSAAAELNFAVMGPKGSMVAMDKDTLRHWVKGVSTSAVSITPTVNKPWDSSVVAAFADATDGSALVSVRNPAYMRGAWEFTPHQQPKRIAAFGKAEIVVAAARDAGTAIAILNDGRCWFRHHGKWTLLNNPPPQLRHAQHLSWTQNGNLLAGGHEELFLHQFSEQRWRVKQFPAGDTRNEVNAIVRRGALTWLGTTSGLVCMEGSRVFDCRLPAAFRSEPITSLLQDRQGTLWASSGSGFAGILRFQQGAWRYFGPEHGLQAGPVHSLFESRDGAIWALSAAPEIDGVSAPGVWRFDGNRFARWNPVPGSLHSATLGMSQTADGALWFLQRRNISRWFSGKWQHWRSGAELAKDGMLFSISRAERGGVWFSDRLNGLGRIHADGKVQYIRILANSRANSVWSIQELPNSSNANSDSDRVLATTHLGVAIVTRDGINLLQLSSGLPQRRFWPIHLSPDEICLGSHGAGLWCMPAQKLSQATPRVFISRSLLGDTVNIGWRAYGWQAKQDAASIETRSRLDGGSWSVWGLNRELQFAAPAAGDHLVEVEARSWAGDVSPYIARHSFQIAGPFWKQLWFQLFMVGLLLFASLAFAANHIRSRRFRAALAASERRFRALIENNHEGILLSDAEGRLQYLSPAAEKLLGFCLSDLEAAPKDAWDFFRSHDHDRDKARGTLEKSVTLPGERLHGELRHHHPELGWRWMEFSCVNLLAEPGVASIVINTRDFTERRQSEEAILLATHRAEEAAQAKSDFLAVMSHEIRTPINGMLGMCQLLESTTLDIEQREYVQSMGFSTRALQTLLNDILDFSRLEAGRMQLETSPCSIQHILQDVTALFEPQLRQRSIGFRTEIDSLFPEAILADANRLRQIILNLVGNAAKFTNHGSIRVVVTTHRALTAGGEREWRLTVEDTGIGIPSYRLPTIFDRFTQADASTNRRFGGSGLGLTIVKALVEAMGGSIMASSIEGKGSAFTIALPLLPALVDVSRASHVEDVGRIDGLHVLVVEDNQVNLTVARRLLEKGGAVVSVATSGFEAIDLCAARTFDIILMDCQMPEMDGLETTRRLRLSEPVGRHTPIIALTANAFAADRENCLAAGMDEFLSKPVDRRDLFRMVQRLAAVPSVSPH
jgi:two-component system, sensor histidine kinase